MMTSVPTIERSAFANEVDLRLDLIWLMPGICTTGSSTVRI
jgi:hypothetical protein